MRSIIQRVMGGWLPKEAAPVQLKPSFILKLGEMEVANLTYDGAAWVFQYTQAFQLQQKIRPIIGFPDKFKAYRSTELWPFFQIRVPSLEQTEVRNFLRQQNLETVDQSTLLKRFGRRSVSNPFELVPSTP